MSKYIKLAIFFTFLFSSYLTLFLYSPRSYAAQSCDSISARLVNNKFSEGEPINLELEIPSTQLNLILSRGYKYARLQVGAFLAGSDENKTPVVLDENTVSVKFTATKNVSSGVGDDHQVSLQVSKDNSDFSTVWCSGGNNATYTVSKGILSQCEIGNIPVKLPLSSFIFIPFKGLPKTTYILEVANTGVISFVALAPTATTDDRGDGLFKYIEISGSPGDVIKITISRQNFSSNSCQRTATLDSSLGQGPDGSSCIFVVKPPNPTNIDTLSFNFSGAPTGYSELRIDGVSNRKFYVDFIGSGNIGDIPPINKPNAPVAIEVFNFARNSSSCRNVININTAGPDDKPRGGGGGSGQTIDCSKDKDNCSSSAGDLDSCGKDGKRINTAIGCVPTDPFELINALLRFSVGIGGGIALLLMIVGSFQMVTSNGDPKALENGRGQFVAALEGLLFIIFSVVLLKIIGVDILGLDLIGGILPIPK